MKYLIILIAAIFASCSPEAIQRRHVRKAEKQLAKAGEAGLNWKIDTVFKTIEVPVPEIRIQKEFITKPVDTVYLTSERLSVKVVRVYDTLRIEGACLPDTLRIEVPVTIEKEITCPPAKWRIWHVLGAAIIFLLVGLALGRILR